MRKFSVLFSVLLLAATASAQVSLDSCRHMALRNNKSIAHAKLSIEQAGLNNKVAQAAYLPNVDLQGTYLYNLKNLSLLEEDALLPVKNFNLSTQGYEFDVVTNPMTGEPIIANGNPIPKQVALLPKDAMTFDIHNVFAAALTVTQPIYMGGKIKAMNAITRYAQDLAQSMHDSKVEDVIYDVDAAYWMVVSLRAKQKLAEGYLKLVTNLDNDVKKMFNEGVATRATLLSVDVRVNEASVALTKVNNGLSLARMALAQLCGLPVDTKLILVDEDVDNRTAPLHPTSANMEQVYANRHDIHSLEVATKIYDQKALVERSAMLPSVAAIGAVHTSNPNTYNGFQKRFGFGLSVGVMVKIPVWHWGGLSNKYKAAQVEARMKRLELDEAKEKIELQVNQAQYRYQEATKTLELTRANLTKAEENLRVAQLAFQEGMATSDDVLTAQTAWLGANSEKIDAEIDLMMCDVYLSKVTGNMKY